MAKRRGWVLTAAVLAGPLVLAVIWAVAVWELVAGHVVRATVLRCGGRSCDVAWVDGREHGITNTDRVARPGSVIKVLHVPGHGVSTLQGTEIAAWGVPAAAVLAVALVLLLTRVRRRRS